MQEATNTISPNENIAANTTTILNMIIYGKILLLDLKLMQSHLIQWLG